MVTCNFVARLLKLLALYHATELIKLCTDRFATGHTYTLKLLLSFLLYFFSDRSDKDDNWPSSAAY